MMFKCPGSSNPRIQNIDYERVNASISLCSHSHEKKDQTESTIKDYSSAFFLKKIENDPETILPGMNHRIGTCSERRNLVHMAGMA